MKIGIDASRYSHPEATGVEWYSWQIINGLAEAVEKDDEIILYSREKIFAPSGTKNRVLPGRRFWTLRSLSAEMKSAPPDVLFVPSHVLPLTIPKKSVITIHDVAFKYLRKSYSFSQYRYLNWSTKSAVKRASKIIVPSEATRDDLISFFKCPKDKIEVIHHGFDPPHVKQKDLDSVFEKSDVLQYFGIKKTTPYILFVGRLESKKNLLRLVEAFKEFTSLHGNYQLILAGKQGLGFAEIPKLVNKLGLVGKVSMPGYVTEEEKAALYKYCNVFAFPSLYEGFGFPVLEAFHYKKPVLTSHVSCLPEIGGDAVHYVDPYDVESIALGLEKLTNDKDYIENLIELGEKRLKKFTWKKASKKTLKVIKNC